MDLSSLLPLLPAVNACLNGVAASLLVAGRIAVRRGAQDLHKRLMLSAFAVSSLFLVLYVVHKAARDFEHTAFGGVGIALTLYRVLLVSHVIPATCIPLLALTLIYLGLSGRLERHRRLARIVWPVWLYVSLTGILLYLVLYPLNPGGS